MKSSNFIFVFITVPVREAQGLAKKVVMERLAACVNIVPVVQSVYKWKGKIESTRESLLILKTRRTLFKKLKTFVTKNHPYDVPEILSCAISNGNKPYLNWLLNETKTK